MNMANYNVSNEDKIKCVERELDVYDIRGYDSKIKDYIEALDDTTLALSFIAFDVRCKEMNMHNFLIDYYKGAIPVDIDKKIFCRTFWATPGYDSFDDAKKDYDFYEYLDSDKHRFYDKYLSPFFIRECQIKLGGFSTCTLKVANDLMPLLALDHGKKVLEIMAGNGLWSAAINTVVARNRLPLNIVSYATDIKVDYAIKYRQQFTPVFKCDCIEAIKDYDFDYVLCSWPREDSPICEAIVEMNKKNPDAVMIYIGEGYGGCCASEKFFEEYAVPLDMEDINNPLYRAHTSLEDINRNFRQWEGMHDHIYLLKCNPDKLK